MIDIHCHLQDKVFDNDRDKVIERARKAGVKYIITSAINPEEVDKALEIVRKYEGYVKLTIGHDPTLVSKDVFEEQIRYVTRSLKVIVGIGEVGLDYWYVRDHDLRELQKKFFIEWIEVARTYDLPLVIHSRSAGKYAIKVLLENKLYNAVMHAYDGSVGYAMEAAKYGIKFSIPPSVTYSLQKQKLVKKLGLEDLLLETDSPVLSPVKGERNEPANIVYSAKKIAEIKNVDFEKVVEVTTENALNVFKRLRK